MTEQLSALADNEIALDYAEHLLSGGQANSSAAEAWSRYHLIGDVMRGTPALSADFKTKLMAEIDKEPTVLSPNAAWFKPATGTAASVDRAKRPLVWATAASLAAVMAVSFMALQTQVGDADSNPGMAALDASIPAEYLMAHQSSAPSASSYYIQSASYAY